METIWDPVFEQLKTIQDEVGLLDQDLHNCDIKERVEEAKRLRAKLQMNLSQHRTELSALTSALGCDDITNIFYGTLKEQITAAVTALCGLRKEKNVRMIRFFRVMSDIENMRAEFSGKEPAYPPIDESKLSLNKLDELETTLKELRREKITRRFMVLDCMNSVERLSFVLGTDFLSAITEVHPSLNDSKDLHSASITDDTLSRLAKTVSEFEEEKQQRRHMVSAHMKGLGELQPRKMRTPRKMMAEHDVQSSTAALEEQEEGQDREDTMRAKHDVQSSTAALEEQEEGQEREETK